MGRQRGPSISGRYSSGNKTPGLRIVAGTEGPAEGTEANAAKIAGARARCRDYEGKPRKERSDAGIPKNRGRRGPRGPFNKRHAPSADETGGKRAQAFLRMRPLSR